MKCWNGILSFKWHGMAYSYEVCCHITPSKGDWDPIYKYPRDIRFLFGLIKGAPIPRVFPPFSLWLKGYSAQVAFLLWGAFIIEFRCILCKFHNFRSFKGWTVQSHHKCDFPLPENWLRGFDKGCSGRHFRYILRFQAQSPNHSNTPTRSINIWHLCFWEDICYGYTIRQPVTYGQAPASPSP